MSDFRADSFYMKKICFFASQAPDPSINKQKNGKKP
jgi:hypothetical protein